MKLGELVVRLDVPFRAATYMLERGHADRWVERADGSGHHRELSGGEAFALALLLELKNAGFRAGEAERVVSIIEESVRGVASQLSWAPEFRPFAGHLRTRHRWFAEIAASPQTSPARRGRTLAYRLTTDANPSGAGKLKAFEWITLSRPRRELPDFRPCLSICIDLARVAELVGT